MSGFTSNANVVKEPNLNEMVDKHRNFADFAREIVLKNTKS